VFILAVTQLPSHFRDGLTHARRLERVRLAVGLHPLAAAAHREELPLFSAQLARTSYVGEVGLDFSSEGKATRGVQVNSFRYVASEIARHGPKVLSVHSRRAEVETLEVLLDHRIEGAIFHWYTGSMSTLESILAAGHFLSVNESMTRSSLGRRVISRIPPERVLTESDGPFARTERGFANPWDVRMVESYLAASWGGTVADVERKIWANFEKVVAPIRSERVGLAQSQQPP